MNETTDSLRFVNQTNTINFYLSEIKQLQELIQNCHFVIHSLKDNVELQRIYADETLPLIDTYNKLVEDLRDILLDHFEWEDQENEPRNFSYWKLYYELDKEELFY